MQTKIVGRNMDITDAIRTHAEQKVGKLNKYDDLLQQVEFVVGQETPSKELFKVETLVAIRGFPEIVAKAEGHDVYLLIDDSIKKAERQLHDLKEKLKLENR